MASASWSPWITVAVGFTRRPWRVVHILSPAPTLRTTSARGTRSRAAGEAKRPGTAGEEPVAVRGGGQERREPLGEQLSGHPGVGQHGTTSGDDQRVSGTG